MESSGRQNKSVLGFAGSVKLALVILILLAIVMPSASAGCLAGKFTVCRCDDGRTETYRTDSDGIQKLKEALSDPKSCCYGGTGKSFGVNTDSSISYSTTSSKQGKWVVDGWVDVDPTLSKVSPCIKSGRMTYYRYISLTPGDSNGYESTTTLNPVVRTIQIESTQTEPDTSVKSEFNIR
jgi:hypothetical protein